jgi:DNA-binding beta-propeller fold protein YncE
MSIETMIEEQANKQRKKKLMIAGGLALLLALILAALLYYFFMRKPITEVLPGRQAAPIYRNSLEGGLDWPLGVAASPDGKSIYVVDSNNKQVRIFNADGEQTGVFGQTASDKTAGTTFSNPLYVAVSPRGKVYTTDRSAAMVAVYDPQTKTSIRFVPQAEKDFTWSPLGIFVDKNGKLYVVDAKKGEHRVLVFDSEGRLLLAFGKEGTNPGEFSFPNGITADGSGNIYVADSNNSRVQVFDKTGKYKFTIGKGGNKGALGHPVGIVFDRRGNLNVVDTFGHNVVVYDKNGKFLYTYGEYGSKNGQFQFPMGIASNGNLMYVVDREGKRVQVWQY